MRAALGRGFPSLPFRYARLVHSSTIAHVSTSPLRSRTVGFPEVRFWPRLCTPFSDCRPSLGPQNLSVRMHLASQGSSYSLVPVRISQYSGSEPGYGFARRKLPSAQSPLPGLGFTLTRAMFNIASVDPNISKAD
jgi:hypothetical protein